MTFTSCSDFLDKMPSTSLPVEEAITTMTDLKNTVNGIGYLMSEGRMTYSADFAIFADLRGGDFQAISNNNQAGPIARYTMTNMTRSHPTLMLILSSYCQRKQGSVCHRQYSI